MGGENRLVLCGGWMLVVVCSGTEVVGDGCCIVVSWLVMVVSG